MKQLPTIHHIPMKMTAVKGKMVAKTAEVKRKTAAVKGKTVATTAAVKGDTVKGTGTNTFHDLTPIPPATHYSQVIEIDI
jgi:hypothetical protein